MQTVIENQQITKIITKKGSSRYQFEDNLKIVSYPTFKSLKLDFPNIQKSDIIIFKKNGHGALTPEQTTNNQALTTGNDML